MRPCHRFSPMGRIIEMSLWKTFYILFTLTFSSVSHAQSIADEINEGGEEFSFEAPPLTTEKIEKISPSGKILVITNSNNSFGKGDFISLVRDNELVTRALVAKTHNGLAGIKIMRYYSMPLFNMLRARMDVQIIRGDDSYFGKKKKSEDADGKTEEMIKDEEDLYNEAALLEDDLEIDENKNRVIKTDNIITAFMAMVEGVDNDGNSKRYNQLNAGWMYQLEDNVWGEITYGQNVINDFPSTGLDTKMTNLTFKIKYTIQAPFYSYLQPYAGYQMIGASSPGAGVDDGSTDPNVLALEEQRVSDLKRNNAIFGITLLKRLVPGWFARFDLGSDVLSFGFGLEF